MSAHTATPWKVCPENPRQIEPAISAAHDVPVATVRYVLGVTDEAEANANAVFIVRACNAHAALVEACADALNSLPEEGECVAMLTAALRLAKGETP